MKLMSLYLTNRASSGLKKNETIKAVEVKTESTIYLVKISAQLDKTMEDYQDDETSFEGNSFDKEDF